MSCSYDHSLKLWDLEKFDCVHTVTGNKAMTCMATSGDATVVATGQADGVVRLWDLRDNSTR